MNTTCADGGTIANSTNPGNPDKVLGAGGSGANVHATRNTSLKVGSGANGKLVQIEYCFGLSDKSKSN